MNRLIILLCLVLFSCNENQVTIVEPQSDGYRRMNLVVKNTEEELASSSNSSISNLQILLFDENAKCIRVIPDTKIVFDENNIYATTLTVPNITKSITVLANAIGYSYPSQSAFVGRTLGDIFLSTVHDASVPLHYFEQPQIFYEGTSLLGNIVEGEDIVVKVDISRIISKIVVQLADNLDFQANDGKGFRTIDSPTAVYINGIDSMFIVDTPAGLNLSFTEYLSDAVGFDYCQIYKVANFVKGSNNMYSDNVVVFPQIDAVKLPFVILSVTGWKGLIRVGVNNPLYYGMRIKGTTINTGLSSEIRSLPRNVVIVLTINNFAGVGSSSHPNPNYQDMLDLTVELKSWSEYYQSTGNME